MEHIAKAVFGLHWREVVFVTYTAYYDASGRSDLGGSTTVASWVASVEDWLSFESAWREVLAQEGVPYFRMAEVAHFQGPFMLWNGNEPRRRRFLDTLASVIDTTIRQGNVAIVYHDSFESVNEQYPLREEFGNAFGFAARICGLLAHDWLQSSHAIYPARWQNSLRHIFDRGDEGFDAMSQGFKRDGYSQPWEEISWDDESRKQRGVVQLQASDWLAYEVGKGLSHWPEIRGSFRRIGEVVPIVWHTFTKVELEAECARRGIAPR